MIRRHKRAILILTIFVLLSAVVGLRTRQESLDLYGKVKREAEGGSKQSQTLTFRVGDSKEQELVVDIAPQERSGEKALELLAEAWEKWQNLYLGQNQSADEVHANLNLPEELCGGLVKVTYESSAYDVLQTDGTVITTDLPKVGQQEVLTVRLLYGNYERIEACNIRLVPPREGSPEWIHLQLQKEIQQREQYSRQESSFILPDSISGQRIYWEDRADYGWVILLLLGVIAAIFLEKGEVEKQRRREKVRREQFMYEYPLMIEQLSVLLESGMTIRRAWERIALKREKQSGDNSLYLQEMRLTLREIREGRGEKEAYERFGARIGLMPYRKFSSILSQNLTRGTWNIRDLLREEAAEAMEMRKNRARKAGEEASTKLLFPMLIMMMLILMVLLLPALGNL